MNIKDSLAVLRNHVKSLRDDGLHTIADAVETLLRPGQTVPTDHCADFEVQGAGVVQVSNSEHHTGTAYGPHFGVSWGQYGWAGGVMDRTEVRRLVDHLRQFIVEPDATFAATREVM